MKYLIFHTERTGSNHLCNLLAQTGIAGIVDFWTCGFFVGLKGQMKNDFEAKLDAYEKAHTTANGVFGAKAGLQYFMEMRREVGTERVMDYLNTINRYVWLRRYDKVAQAVSGYFAGHTKRWHSDSETNRPDPEYSKNQVDWVLMGIAAEEARMQEFFNVRGITPLQVFYEDLIADPENTVYSILDFINVKLTHPVELKPHFKKLNNPKKGEYIARYYEDVKHGTA